MNETIPLPPPVITKEAHDRMVRFALQVKGQLMKNDMRRIFKKIIASATDNGLYEKDALYLEAVMDEVLDEELQKM